MVARRLRVTPATVCKWRGRFVEHRLDGLYDEPQPGAARTITDDAERRTFDYKRHGTLFAALNAQTVR